MSSVKPKLRDAAIASGLVTEQQLRHAIAAVVQTHAGVRTANDVSDKKLARQLIKTKLLSEYQAEQLLSGRTKLTLGPYIITDWIGQGGMGQVFKAVHELLGRESAIKVLPLHKITPEAISNFRREIRAQAKLDHPNLVRAFDAGEDGNVQYLVVEYVPGTDLRRLVRSKGKLSINQAANIVRQAAEGLKQAHKGGLIHRDIKPGNILVTPDGLAKLSDLGLAFCLDDPKDPRVGKIVGTADYLSPEQIKNPNHITSASDIYSLGCTLYYAVTGKVPFPGGNSRNKAKRHLEETPWHPRRFNEEVSDEFVDLMSDMMAKDPRQRIQTATEVAERLSPWAEDNSPLRDEDLDERPRWTSPSTSIDAQPTDPNMDIAELAMSEISDNSGAEATLSGDDSVTEAESGSGVLRPKPPIPTSVAGKYKSAGHLPDENLFSMMTLIVTSGLFMLIGILIGFVTALLAMGR
ncbi:serine/threonine protein kinase [Mariniblastus fucicola]|uniref:Serine/threonine-protein kinase PknA n=1 Tax=Mariniblastus fucicola TaxID=980251 RepID=A0A5B9P3L1_9BACT|nr:serine/threonine-protein kinase [Mariniblastus fucicola]QEG21167.1 Serine/threonine-protein kinase PknA [Mariniblastus fucicola]